MPPAGKPRTSTTSSGCSSSSRMRSTRFVPPAMNFAARRDAISAIAPWASVAAL